MPCDFIHFVLVDSKFLDSDWPSARVPGMVHHIFGPCAPLLNSYEKGPKSVRTGNFKMESVSSTGVPVLRVDEGQLENLFSGIFEGIYIT